MFAWLDVILTPTGHVTFKPYTIISYRIERKAGVQNAPMAKGDSTWEIKLGRQIRTYRLKRGLTQQEAADLMRCPMRWWQTLEKGRNTSVDTLMRVSGVLNVPVWKLLKWDTASVRPTKRTGLSAKVTARVNNSHL
jgi:hypothetical protein